MKKFRMALTIGLALGWVPATMTPSSHAATPPEIVGRSAIAFDARSGKVFFRKDETLAMPIASTQKLLTALLVIERGGLDGIVTIAPADTKAEPTKLYLKPGEKYTRRELLHALLLRSANDVALALARDHSGSAEAFAAAMNQRMKELGARSTNFINPNGLPAEGQISNARDLAVLARVAYLNPTLRSLVATPEYSFRRADGTTVALRNTNRVLRNWGPCNGMKTGYTRASGHCLVASATLDGRHVIAVVLGSNKASVWSDAQKLLAYGLETGSGLSPQPQQSDQPTRPYRPPSSTSPSGTTTTHPTPPGQPTSWNQPKANPLQNYPTGS